MGKALSSRKDLQVATKDRPFKAVRAQIWIQIDPRKAKAAKEIIKNTQWFKVAKQ